MSYDEILLQWLDQSAAKGLTRDTNSNGLTRGANAHLVSDLVENEGSSYKWSALIIINGGHRILIKFTSTSSRMNVGLCGRVKIILS